MVSMENGMVWRKNVELKRKDRFRMNPLRFLYIIF